MDETTATALNELLAQMAVESVGVMQVSDRYMETLFRWAAGDATEEETDEAHRELREAIKVVVGVVNDMNSADEDVCPAHGPHPHVDWCADTYPAARRTCLDCSACRP